MLALALAASLASPGRAASLFVQYLHKAESRQEPAERVEWYTRAIAAFDEKEDGMLLAQCHFGRGEARVELWDFAAADGDLTKAIDYDPGNLKARLLRGRVRLRLAKNAEAAQDLSEYLSSKPDDEEGWLLRAEAELKLGRKDAAFKSCQRAQKTEDADGRAWLCEARVWMGRESWAEAEKALGLADAKARHGLAEALTERAVCRVAQGRHEDALKDYADALPLYETQLTELRQRAAPEPAQADRRQTAARAYFGRGRVREFLAQNAAALADYERACQLGHEQACARLQGLSPQASTVKPKPAAPAEPAEPPPPKPAKRKRLKNPKGDPGERIYGG